MRTHAKATSAIAALSCGIVLCLCASSAMAAKTVVGFVGEAGVLGGQFDNAGTGPAGAAVNLNGTGGASAGDVYIVDRSNNRVQQFKADGTWVRAFGLNVGGVGVNVCEVKASCLKASGTLSSAGGMSAPQGIAIEQSTGNLYVTDLSNRRVDVFSATGTFQGAFAWNVKSPGGEEKLQLCTTGCKAGSNGANAGQFGTQIGYPAINPLNGNILVADRVNRRVDEFQPTITAGVITDVAFVRAYGWKVDKTTPLEEFQTCTTATGCQAGTAGTGSGQFATASPTALAVDFTGRVYALDSANKRIQAFSAALAPEGVFAAATLSGEPVPIDLGFDSASNHLMVTKPCTALACPGALSAEQRVQELDAAGNPIQAWAAKSGIPSSTGLAVGSGTAYMTTKEGGPGNKPGFFILGDPVPPAVTIDPITTFTGTTATFEGDIQTDTIEARYHWEYSLDGSNWTRVPAKASEDKSLPGNGAENAVSVNVTGLTALSEYQVRLVASKAYAGGSAEAQTSFTTASAPPVLNGVTHSHIRDTSAQLNATIHPENEETEYRFEYVDQAGFEAEGFTGAESAPVPPGQLSGGEAKEVHEPLGGLEAETTYRYRLLAENDTGSVESSVSTFITYASPQVFDPCPNDNQFRINKPAAKLPDCRAYEQVTPIDKNGGNVQSPYNTNKASPSGHRISFAAVAGLPGGEGAQDFPTYLATREGGEWSTQGLLPAASAGSSARLKGWTPDFARVFSRVTKPGIGTALVSRSSADGSLTAITPYSSSLTDEIHYSGASADGSQVLFQTTADLPVAAGSPPPTPSLTNSSVGNLYAWNRDSGELYFAGGLPDGSAAAKGAAAGIVTVQSNGIGISRGYNQDTHAVAEDGSVYFTDQKTGQLYRRLNPAAPETTTKDGKGNCVPDPVLACTVHVSSSEKTDGGGLEGHDAAGPQRTKFMAASTDATKAIFTSSEKLTNDAYTGFEPDPAAIARADIADGENKDLSFLPTFADAIDVEGEYVYWTDPENDRIGRAKLDKSLYEEDFITGLNNLKGLAVIDEPGAQYVFWTSPAETEWTEDSPITGEGTIGRADLDGGNADSTCLEGITNPRSIDVDTEHIYWTSPGTTMNEISFGDGKVGRAGLDCNEAGVVPELLDGKASGDIAVNQSHIYISAFREITESSFVSRHDLDGTPAGLGIVGVNGTAKIPAGIALDGSNLYWTSPGESKIGRSDLAGTNASQEHSFITGAGRPQSLAGDSTHIYWSANQEVLPNAGNDLYSYDAEAPVGERLTDLAPEDDGEIGVEVQGVLGTSEDASYVYFVANGIPDGTISNSPNANGEEAQTGNCNGTLGEVGVSGTCNLYLVHEGEITFIARLDAKSAPTGAESTSDAANWVASDEDLDLSSVKEKTARVTPDGQTLLFRSQRQLTDYDNKGPKCVRDPGFGIPSPGPCIELYRYRVGEPGLICVSCNPTGVAPVGPAGLVSISSSQVGAQQQIRRILSRNLSADGDRIFFDTPDPLVAADSNGDESCDLDMAYFYPPRSCQDVYEWEAAGAGSCPEDAGQKGCLYLLSTGTSPEPSFFGDASVSGDDAFIFTFSQLVRQDEDDLLDVYDARVEGGLSSQDATPPVSCEGEACKAGASTPPVTSSAGSSTFSAPGNPQAIHKKANKNKKKKNKKKNKRRRQAKKKQQKKRHGRAAHKTGRASR